MNKVVYNVCYGGYSLSIDALRWLTENAREEIKVIAKNELDKLEREGNLAVYGSSCETIDRHDPDLVRCIETIGEKANAKVSKLEIHEIEGKVYRIDEYDGWEDVKEPDDEEYITIK